MSADHSATSHHPPPSGPHPVFESLDDAEMRAVLTRNYVGRIAFTLHDRVDLEPVGYIYDDEWIYGRTAPGPKLSTISHQPWVAFEVDEFTSIFDWRSVVVHGRFDVLDETWHQPDVVAHATELLRRIVPETLRADDPVPFRTVIFRIHLSQVTGRRCHLESSSAAS